ncbi:MAG: hypothetical protein K6A94_03965 [Bacteroidales bacterium]|nr:hypothetical protein [Bacteroidales bacterium]
METHLFSAVQEKEKPHRYEGAFRGVWATFRISKQLLAKGNEYLSHAEIAEYAEADGHGFFSRRNR